MRMQKIRNGVGSSGLVAPPKFQIACVGSDIVAPWALSIVAPRGQWFPGRFGGCPGDFF